MAKLSINGIKMSYEAIDCTDKLVIIKATTEHIGSSDKALAVASECFKKYGAKRVIAVSNNIDLETMDTETAICKIDDYIDCLHRLKEELLEDEEDNKDGE